MFDRIAPDDKRSSNDLGGEDQAASGPDVSDGCDPEGFHGGCRRAGHSPETCPNTADASPSAYFRAENWRPMETAPKDRRVLLLFPKGPATSRVHFGKWDDDRYNRRPRPYWTREGQSNATNARENPPIGWLPDIDPEAEG